MGVWKCQFLDICKRGKTSVYARFKRVREQFANSARSCIRGFRWLSTYLFLITLRDYTLIIFRMCYRDTHHKIRNTRYTLFAFHSNFVFRLRNSLIFCAIANPGAKCEKRGVKHEEVTQNTTYILFVFCILWTFLRILR